MHRMFFFETRMFSIHKEKKKLAQLELLDASEKIVRIADSRIPGRFGCQKQMGNDPG
jgi:hypothetical protein